MEGPGTYIDKFGNVFICSFSKGLKTGFAEIKMSNGNSLKVGYNEGKLCGAS